MAYFDEGSAMKSAQAHCAQIANFLQENPGAWTRRAFAVDRDGNPCDPRSSGAVALCAIGLVMRFIPTRELQSQAERLLSRAITPYGATMMRSPAAYNDNEAQSVQDVILMFRAASYLPEVRKSPPSLWDSPDAWLFKTGITIGELEGATGSTDVSTTMPDWAAMAVSGELLTIAALESLVAGNSSRVQETAAA